MLPLRLPEKEAANMKPLARVFYMCNAETNTTLPQGTARVFYIIEPEYSIL
jgi:hypothetical protein